MLKNIFLVLCLIVSMSQINCGGGGGGSGGGSKKAIAPNETQTLDDELGTNDSQLEGSYYDTIILESIPANTDIDINVTSVEFDAQIFIYQGKIESSFDYNDYLDYADSYGTGEDEWLDYSVTEDDDYTIIVTSYAAGETGKYTIDFTVNHDSSADDSDDDSSDDSSSDSDSDSDYESCSSSSCGICSHFSYLSCSCVSDYYCAVKE